MSETKSKNVPYWGIFVLQRLNHFFNRTDYCDLTLKFKDNSQLRVHRLVLNTNTEYFELLEKTCEMHNDCLVMPDNLQADTVVPIINFLYTGLLEFKTELLEKMYACSEIMDMPVITKLIDSLRSPSASPSTSEAIKSLVPSKKRSYCKAFKKSPKLNILPLEVQKFKQQKLIQPEPRPTRYELPEELDSDNLFANSFCKLSYTSPTLMVHPETIKQYSKPSQHEKGLLSTTKSKLKTLDIIKSKNVLEETASNLKSKDKMFTGLKYVTVETECDKDPNKLFNQLLDNKQKSSPKVTTKPLKKNKSSNIDHAKIISEVLKKYPHLVTKNIDNKLKFKIFNNPTVTKPADKKHKPSQPVLNQAGNIKMYLDSEDTYETDVIDSKEVARLVALGAENILGPWICLICGTPGKALQFTSYYKFRRHLVEMHKENPILNTCEYCGKRITNKRNLQHHLYLKHNVEPPPIYYFPKCQQCNYIALNEALLKKHIMSSHSVTPIQIDCNVFPSSFNSSKILMTHFQNTGHKYIAEGKTSHGYIQRSKVCTTQNYLNAHLRTIHKVDGVKDCISDVSVDESKEPIENKYVPVLNEAEDNMEYETIIANMQLIQKKTTEKTPTKQTTLHGFTPASKVADAKSKALKALKNISADKDTSHDHFNEEEIVLSDSNEYSIISGDGIILKNTRQSSEEYILSDKDLEISVSSPKHQHPITPLKSMGDVATLSMNENIQQANILMKDSGMLSESLPIYVPIVDEYNDLMGSNPPIIFDTADGNKSFSVLTTPEAVTLSNTCIALDNAHNSNVLIIQDNDPLNGTESNVTDNSNLVVVYSQQQIDSNTGYQILTTTQALDDQYALTAGINSHNNNYQPVSALSPVMHAQSLDSSIQSWQGEGIHKNINHTTNLSGIQSLGQPEKDQVAKAQPLNNDKIDVPEFQLETNQLDALSQIEKRPSEAPSGNMTEQPETEPEIQSSQIIPLKIDNSVGATIEIAMDNVHSNNEYERIVPPKNLDYVTENEVVTKEIEQIPESDIDTEIIIMEVPNSKTIISYGPGTDEKTQNDVDETVHERTVKRLEAVMEANAEPFSIENNIIASEVVQGNPILPSEWSGEDISKMSLTIL